VHGAGLKRQLRQSLGENDKESMKTMASTRSKSKKTKGKPAKTATTKAKKPAAKNAKAGQALPKDLEKRLIALARKMEKTMDGVVLQALNEFADAWEDHFRTVTSLQDDDRMVLSVKAE